MKNYLTNQADAKRPVNPTEEQQFPFIIDNQGNEPVNFAGIPLRLLKPHSSKVEVVYDFEIVTKNMETKRIKLICDQDGCLNEEEAAAIRSFLLRDSTAVAFTSEVSTVDKVSGEVEKIRECSSPYVKIGPLQWSTVYGKTWERMSSFSVDRHQR